MYNRVGGWHVLVLHVYRLFNMSKMNHTESLFFYPYSVRLDVYNQKNKFVLIKTVFFMTVLKQLALRDCFIAFDKLKMSVAAFHPYSV